MKILLNHWNNVLYDVDKELVRIGHEVVNDIYYLKNPKGIDVGIFWNETDAGSIGEWGTWRSYVKKFKKLGIKTILLQHGRKGTSRIYPPFNEKLESDVVCSWGENDKKGLMSCGVPENRIVVTGTTILKHIKPRVKNKRPVVLFCPEHWGSNEVDENLCIATRLRRLEGVDIITKILEGEHEPDWYDNPVSTHRMRPGHLDTVMKVLSKADVVVSISESTLELIAQVMDIPVVIADVWIPKACNGDDRYKIYNRTYSNACEMAKFDELNEKVMYAIKHPEHLREERKQIAIADGGTNIKDPLKEIIKVIEA